MLDHSGDEDERRTSRKSSPPDATHFITASFLSTLPSFPVHSLSLHHHHSFFSKLPHRLPASLYPVVYHLFHPAHLYFKSATVADNPTLCPVPPAPSPCPPSFHSHHHPLSSALLLQSRTPPTDLLLLLFPFLHLLLSSLCSPSLFVQPGEHREEKSKDPAEEADPEETSSTGPAGKGAH